MVKEVQPFSSAFGNGRSVCDEITSTLPVLKSHEKRWFLIFPHARPPAFTLFRWVTPDDAPSRGYSASSPDFELCAKFVKQRLRCRFALRGGENLSGSLF